MDSDISSNEGNGTNSDCRRPPALPPPPTRTSLDLGSSHPIDNGKGAVPTPLSPLFPHDHQWQKILRYLHILPPVPDETPTNRKIRIYIWCSLILDLICAIVAIGTFTVVTECCGIPIWSIGAKLNWTKAMNVITYIYIIGILLEVIPVVRESGIPWNMLNPMFGFLLTLAVFFDDSRAEAVSMAVMESMAVFFDFLVYRLKRQKHLAKMSKIDEITEQLGTFIHAAKREQVDEEMENDHREIRLLRERRNLRQEVVDDQRHLNHHLVGVIINSILIVITLVLISTLASTGGMCVHSGKTPNPFSQNPLELCSSCQGTTGKCQICTEDTQQCYYPY
jgi:hypothetical protein